MNKNVDIREHAIIIKLDRGHEEVEDEIIDAGITTDGEIIRIVVLKDEVGDIVRIKIQNL